MSKYISLHNHTSYSIQDSVIKIPEIIQKAKDGGQNTIAITDHGSVSGLLEFNKECVKQNIKPIFGCEYYFINNYETKKDEQRQHLVLLAKDEIGLKQLYKLNVISNKNFYYRPVLEYNELLNIDKGHLICTSACGFSNLAQLIVNNATTEEIDNKYYWFYEIFGEDFYLELQPHLFGEYDDQRIINQGLMDLADRVLGKLIITTDAHYINPEDRTTRVMLQAIAYKNTYEEQLKSNYKTLSSNYYCSTREEIWDLVWKYNESLPSDIGFIESDIFYKACANTVDIASRCKDNIFPKYEKRIPVFNRHKELLEVLGV